MTLERLWHIILMLDREFKDFNSISNAACLIYLRASYSSYYPQESLGSEESGGTKRYHLQVEDHQEAPR